jgi:predicted metal-dependent hydrolase
MNEMLEVGELMFEVRRSGRRKTLGLTVDRHGELLVHAPEGETTTHIETWVRSKLLWVHRRLTAKERLASALREPEFVSGESFSVLGRYYPLRIDPAQAEPLRFDGRKFCLNTQAIPAAACHFRVWFIATGRVWVREWVVLLSRKVGCSPVRADVRDLGYRWGSCGRNGVLYVNWRTIQLPVRLVDYVLAHELSHLIEPTHAPEFWEVVDRAMPDWRDRREELDRKVSEVFWCGAEMGQERRRCVSSARMYAASTS